MSCSVLADHPLRPPEIVLPESPGPLFDATEIDEILVLRTLALGDDEKRRPQHGSPRPGS